MMRRIYSNYEEKEFEVIQELAEELGFTLSSLQRYALLLFSNQKLGLNLLDDGTLISAMLKELKKIPVGQKFIVSALLPDLWPKLSREKKMILAKQLSIKVKNSIDFEIYKKSKSKATIYIRKTNLGV